MMPVGIVTLFHIPTLDSLSEAIMPGPDDKLWFTE